MLIVLPFSIQICQYCIVYSTEHLGNLCLKQINVRLGPSPKLKLEGTS
jgi:hypothetical protein